MVSLVGEVLTAAPQRFHRTIFLVLGTFAGIVRSRLTTMFLAQDTVFFRSFLLEGLTHRGSSTLMLSVGIRLSVGLGVSVSVRRGLLCLGRCDTKFLNVLKNNEEPAGILWNGVLT